MTKNFIKVKKKKTPVGDYFFSKIAGFTNTSFQKALK